MPVNIINIWTNNPILQYSNTAGDCDCDHYKRFDPITQYPVFQYSNIVGACTCDHYKCFDPITNIAIFVPSSPIWMIIVNVVALEMVRTRLPTRSGGRRLPQGCSSSDSDPYSPTGLHFAKRESLRYGS